MWCPLLIFDLVLRRLSLFHSHSLNFLPARCELRGHLWLPQRSEGPPFCVRTMGPETGNNPCGWPVTSAYDIWYILADILRCTHHEVKNSQHWTFMARQLFKTNHVWYEFNIFLTSDYKKRWWDLYITPNSEYWHCKVGFRFLKLYARSIFKNKWSF